MEDRTTSTRFQSTDSGDRDAINDPSALSETLSRLSINPATVALPQSPVSNVSQKQQARASKDLVSTMASTRRISAGSSRRTSGNKNAESQSKSPHAIRTTVNNAEVVSNRIKSEHGVLEEATQDHVTPLSLQAPITTPSHVPENDQPTTAASIAAEHFRQELLRHETSDVATPSTIVIIHDACYGHRYSRRKTTKAQLNTIVERPERIQAVLLGVSSAYVRLGEHYTGGKNEPRRRIDTGDALPFVIRRTTRSVPLGAPVVTAVHGSKWMQELKMMCNSAESRISLGEGELARLQSSEDELPKAELHAGDLYLCRESLNALQGALGGVLDGVDEVFKTRTTANPTACKKAFVCIRPPGHHCSADMPSGFCWLNNVHVGIEHAAQVHGLTHAAIIDFDLHHGDGSQTITWQRNDKASKMPKNTPAAKRTSIGYFSLHDINSYPCEYGDIEKVQNASLCIETAHGQTIWNVHLQPWKTEAEFWALYETRYLVLLDKARAFLKTQTQRVRGASVNGLPKSAIFISAGFDASEWEGEGMQRHKVNVPTEFYRRFTSDINRLADEEGTSVDGRVISVLEGGYSDRALTSSVLSHLTGLVSGFTDSVGSNLMGSDVKLPLGGSSVWWDADALAHLESIVRPDSAKSATKKSRLSELTFHATPTESFLAKVVDRTKVQRAPPTTPNNAPPEIDWAVSAHELSKLLIPKDRQVDSCRFDELNEPRAKKERQSIMALPSAERAVERAQTRGRKPKSTEQLRTTTGNEIILPKPDVPITSGTSNTPELSMVNDDIPGGSQEPLSQPTAMAKPIKAVKARTQGNRTAIDMQDPASQRLPKASKPAVPAQKVHRTRRVSMLPQDTVSNQDVGENATSSVSFPDLKAGDHIESPKSKPDTVSAPPEAQSKDHEVEKLVSGIKRITLKLPPKEVSKAKKNTGNTTTATTSRAQKAGSKSQHGPPVELTDSNIAKATSVPERVSAETLLTHQNSVAVVQAEGRNTPISTSVAVSAVEKTELPLGFVKPSLTAANGSSSDSKLDTSAGDAGSQSVEKVNVTPLLDVAAELPKTPNTETIQPAQHPIIQQESTTNPPPTTTTIPTSNPHLNSNNFIPYLTSEAATHTIDSHAHQPSPPLSLTWLPPNSNTPPPSPPKAKARELPIFTASSHIPFGRPVLMPEIPRSDVAGPSRVDGMIRDGSRDVDGLATGKEDIWTVLETPKG